MPPRIRVRQSQQHLCSPRCDQPNRRRREHRGAGPVTCGEGETVCGGRCAVLSKDIDNCRGCGAKCTAPPNGSAVCIDSQCGFACVGEFSPCGDQLRQAAKRSRKLWSVRQSVPDACAWRGNVQQWKMRHHVRSTVCAMRRQLRRREHRPGPLRRVRHSLRSGSSLRPVQVHHHVLRGYARIAAELAWTPRPAPKTARPAAWPVRLP